MVTTLPEFSGPGFCLIILTYATVFDRVVYCHPFCLEFTLMSYHCVCDL